jgi:hypothetical protein
MANNIKKLNGLNAWLPTGNQKPFFGVDRGGFWKDLIEKQRIDEFIKQCQQIKEKK